MNEALALLVQAGIDAGQVILSIREDLDGWQKKHDGSPVTEADQASETLILERLAALAPDALVMAEEGIAAGSIKPATAAQFFLVDALDGTWEFVKGRPYFTVNIGRISDGVPDVGVVVAPALGEGFAADAGGAYRFRIEQGLAVEVEGIHARIPEPALDVLISQTHPSKETERYLDRFDVRSREAYGSSLKLCRLAEGGKDLYPRFGRTMEWDTAAGDAILRRAGGSVRTMDGRVLTYGKLKPKGDSAFANPPFAAFGAWPAARLEQGRCEEI